MTHVLDHARIPSRSRLFGLADYLALIRQRRALARLDPSRLDDIGVTRSEAMSEAQRPVWDVPSHWTR